MDRGKLPASPSPSPSGLKVQVPAPPAPIASQQLLLSLSCRGMKTTTGVKLMSSPFFFFSSFAAPSFSPFQLPRDWAAVPELTALALGTLYHVPTFKGLFTLRNRVPSLRRNV